VTEFEPAGSVPAVSSAATSESEPESGTLNRLAETARGIEGIDDLPLAEAARRLEALHSELQAALAELDRN
jgi:hypothetical protein